MGEIKKGQLKKRWFIAAVFVFLLLIFAVLLFMKKIRIASLWADRYDVQGVDVSHHQGEINWHELAGNEIEFAFIKATEGSSHLDEQFLKNWKEASRENLMIGAYHFFSFDSPGESQAAWFIQNAGSLTGKLAPVVDVEYYGDKEKHPPEEESVRENLQSMLTLLEKEYRMKPILYTTYSVYKKYIRGHFDDYPLWIRNVYYYPNLDLGDVWTFWQFTDRARLTGYEGKEAYIDMNVFLGDGEELKQYICP